jgi:addiction module HigA family antidote
MIVEKNRETYPPLHPGVIIQAEYLEPNGLSAHALAVHLGVEPMRIYRIIRGEQGVSTDTALRLARFFGTSARFWMNLQDHYELQMAERDARLVQSLAEIQPLASQARNLT